jgi:photosystem II stability/assembly factor-like uncharacterized protein
MIAMQLNRGLLIVALTLSMSSNAWPASVNSMKLLAPNVGWAETEWLGEHNELRQTDLFWTTDGGANWRRITPPIHDRRFDFIADTFFLDTHRGWALLCCGPPPDPDLPYDEHQPLFTLATTTDAGTTWSTARVNIAIGADRADMSAASWHGGIIAFADSLHGWMKLVARSTPNSSWGPFLSTSDGGRTWRAAPDPPGDDLPFSLVTPTEGWQISGPSDEHKELSDQDVHVTRDGAKSWHQVSVRTPKEIRQLLDVIHLPPTPAYYLPTFQDSKHGFLPVIYTAQEFRGKSAVVLFETADGGRSWKPARTIPNLEIPCSVNLPGDPQLFAVADSTLIVVSSSNHYTHFTLTRDGPDGRTDADISNYVMPRDEWFAPESQLSFATRKQGWMRNYAGLWSTSDGGATWKSINPK